MKSRRVLLSSVCKPIGPTVGDSDAVSYELLHGQVTRAQHIYSPRVTHKQFSLDYISENLDTPSVVLHYPSRRTFIREIKKGYDVICIGFVLSTAHHMKVMCRLIRTYAPKSKIVLGGYGTVMSDEELLPFCDAICREEGVAFMRKYLEETFLPLDYYRHPEVRSRLRVFGVPVAHTAMVFAGLGCPNGCDFCCTSHFFKKKHIKLLPTGKDIFDVMNNYKKIDPNIDYTILDEDFLLDRSRGGEFLENCRKYNKRFSIFAFASVKALSQYSYDELNEMGIDGVWVGYEGKKSGYSKHEGKNIDELIRELQDHGITVLASMIVGIPYQNDEIARKEFDCLQSNRPALTQYLIYGPTPGTPFYEDVMKKDLLEDDAKNDRVKYYKKCTGFYAMVKHPFMRRNEIESLQREFYAEDFKRSGPSIVRVGEVKYSGWKKYKDHEDPKLRKRADYYREKMAAQLSVLPVAIFGPKISFKNRLQYIKQYFKIFKACKTKDRLYALAAPIMFIGAMVTWFNISFNLMEHPVTRYYLYPGRLAKKQRVKRRLKGLLKLIPIKV